MRGWSHVSCSSRWGTLPAAPPTSPQGRKVAEAARVIRWPRGHRSVDSWVESVSWRTRSASGVAVAPEPLSTDERAAKPAGSTGAGRTRSGGPTPASARAQSGRAWASAQRRAAPASAAMRCEAKGQRALLHRTASVPALASEVEGCASATGSQLAQWKESQKGWLWLSKHWVATGPPLILTPPGSVGRRRRVERLRAGLRCVRRAR